MHLSVDATEGAEKVFVTYFVVLDGEKQPTGRILYLYNKVRTPFYFLA